MATNSLNIAESTRNDWLVSKGFCYGTGICSQGAIAVQQFSLLVSYSPQIYDIRTPDERRKMYALYLDGIIAVPFVRPDYGEV